MRVRSTCALVAASTLLAGCATGPRGASLRDCALVAASAGVVAGAATGAIYAEDRGHEAEGAAVGAGTFAGTALLGLGVCWLLAPERALAQRELPESCDPCGHAHGPRLARAPDAVALPVGESEPWPPAAVPAGNPCEDAPVTLQGVHFDTARHELRPEGELALQGVASQLQSCTTRRVRVEAHTDSRGSDAYNRALSERRALSVLLFLVDQGVASHRLDSKGWGETRPADTNATPAGRARNRRVELHPLD